MEARKQEKTHNLCRNKEASDKKELADANSYLNTEGRCEDGKGPALLEVQEGNKRESLDFEQSKCLAPHQGAETGLST